jgi:hypothetical protein
MRRKRSFAPEIFYQHAFRIFCIAPDFPENIGDCGIFLIGNFSYSLD